MPLNVRIERIQEAEGQITDLTSEETRMRGIYLQDGVIDATEQDALDRIRSKIERLSQAVSRLRAEVEENRRIWESHGAEWADVQQKLAALEAFGHPDAGTVATSVGEVTQAVSDQRWADATTALQQILHNIGPIWENYETLRAAKEEYEPLRADFDTRLAAVEGVGPYSDALTGQIAQIRGNVSAIDAAAASGDWPGALTLMREAIAALEPVEAEVVRVEQAKAAYEAELAAVQPRLLEASSSEYARLAEQNQAIATLQGEMESAAAAHDYEGASAKLAELAPLVDAYLAERDTLDQARAAYESALAPLETRLRAAASCELATAGEVQQRMLTAEGEMRALAEAEDYGGALAKLGEVEAALTEYEGMVGDKDLYEARLAAIRDELLEFSTSRPETAYLQPIQTQMATIQTDMETAAAAEDYTTALAKIAELEAKIAECLAAIAEKRQDYETARAGLDRQVQAAEADATDAGGALDTEIRAVRATLPPIDTAAGAEDWVEAKRLIQPALDAVAAFNAAMMRAELPGMTAVIPAGAIDIAARSPELVSTLEELEAAGWQVQLGTPGKGSYCSRGANPTIVLDPNRLATDLGAVQVLAHEAGHAEYENEPDTSSRENYVNDMLADEGAATMENIRVQREILANGGPDIGIAGNAGNHADYNAAFDQYMIDGDADACRNRMGQIFGRGERTSTTGELYEDYYGGSYDRNHTLSGQLQQAWESVFGSEPSGGDASDPHGHGHSH